MREADGFERVDEVPADVRLPPAQAEFGGTGVVMMIGVPVLAPSGELERAEPPNVLAGVAVLGVAEVRKAIHQTLHVQRVDEANSTGPEKTLPPQQQPGTKRKHNHRAFSVHPELVDAFCKVWSPL